AVGTFGVAPAIAAFMYAGFSIATGASAALKIGGTPKEQEIRLIDSSSDKVCANVKAAFETINSAQPSSKEDFEQTRKDFMDILRLCRNFLVEDRTNFKQEDIRDHRAQERYQMLNTLRLEIRELAKNFKSDSVMNSETLEEKKQIVNNVLLQVVEIYLQDIEFATKYATGDAKTKLESLAAGLQESIPENSDLQAKGFDLSNAEFEKYFAPAFLNARTEIIGLRQGLLNDIAPFANLKNLTATTLDDLPLTGLYRLQQAAEREMQASKKAQKSNEPHFP
ncbi:MAG: hypothetical protein L7F78_06680, partial [Syntrophales bacterium LBB04]|nr:hypothetical protein [Syntrophales bacterium LBB04]